VDVLVAAKGSLSMGMSRWLLGLGVVGLLAGSTGCGRFVAGRMATAPNRYPQWLAPETQTQLSFPATWFTNFPPEFLAVGPPPARMLYRVVPPADYAVCVTRSNHFSAGQERVSFRFTAQLPAPANRFTAAPRGTLFLLHGYGGDSALMLPLALRLAEEGWWCVVPDLRGHGHSTGARISYGVIEEHDLRALLAALRPRRPGGPVAVLGHSYGAAVGLRWAGANDRVTRAVALAPYARLAEAGLNLRQLYTPWFPEGLSQAGLRALPELVGAEPGDLDPATVIQRAPVKALFVVGTADLLTPPADSSRLATLAAPGSRLLLVPGADHESVPYYFDPVMAAVVAWLATEPR
jgi:pimeloyl-ACP methyl ester carboxylesterase